MKYILVMLICILLPGFSFANKLLYVRGQILHFIDDPDKATSTKSYQHFEDGLLIIDDGVIRKLGDWSLLKKDLPSSASIQYYKNGLIVPGFIDTHIHYPQLDMIAANSGGELFTWLNQYTFPFEEKFKDNDYSKEVANFFLDELLRNGTTTAVVFATVYPQAINNLFAAAQLRKMRIITGQVLGDRNLPAHLMQNPDEAAHETEKLIKKWHNKPGTRLLYSIQFRFAPTTSPTLFNKLSLLRKNNPDTYIHSHISENKKDVAWSTSLFDKSSYLDIYDQYHLLGAKTILAHGVHLTTSEEIRMTETGTAVSFCPTSNLFLGSGLFNLDKARATNLLISLGTDVGAGTTFSMLQVMNEAYKVAQMRSQKLSALKLFYLATLGGAKALKLEDKLGSFKPGREADFVVLNIAGATPLLKRRLSFTKTIDDKLFVLMTLADDRSVMDTFVLGERVSLGGSQSIT